MVNNYTNINNTNNHLCTVMDHHRIEGVSCFVDIGGIVDHHWIEVVVCFVDIGGIVDHHWIEVVVSTTFVQ
jgi:hypothetical protein